MPDGVGRHHLLGEQSPGLSEERLMVRVSQNATDRVIAWRVRDALAGHPLLGGATAQISIRADFDSVTLEGCALDERVEQLALRLAMRAAGRRPVRTLLRIRHCAAGHGANATLTDEI